MHTNLKVGLGYDVHRLVPGRKLIMGGVEIPFEKGLLGHSDADVLVHAVMDALLGAAGFGDIGRCFPDQDPKYKDISSMLLLEKVCCRLKNESYRIVNIDTVIVAQNPKLAPYIKEMEQNLKSAMGINSINIKATTEEGLGFTGEGMGVAAKAVCLIEKSQA